MWQGLISWSILLLGSWFSVSPVVAQCPNTIPHVQDYGTGSYSVKKVGDSCLPLTVNVKNTLPGSVNVLTLFNYQGGPINPDSLTSDTLHTYTRPGKYTIVQFSEKEGRKLIACPTVYVYDTLPPSARLVPCGRNQAKLIFDSSSASRYNSHWIAWGDGTIQEVLPRTLSVSHVFDTPPPHTITVWGTINPGLCRSRDLVLQFDPTRSSPLPSINSFSMQNAATAELIISNPLRSELLLERKVASGDWESTGHTVHKEKETLLISVDSLDTPCFRLQAIDSCLAESYVSEMLCSALLHVNTTDRANELSWTAQVVPPQAQMSIWKDATFWHDVSALGARGYLEDPDLNCGRKHCYQLLITTATQNIASQLLCLPTPFAFCNLALPLFIPDAFSPNGDGINDFFEIKGEVPSSFELSVFNPWGKVIFHTLDPNLSWNGKYEDTTVPAGTYPYTLTVGEPGSTGRYTRKGTVLVIK